jgi:hypothetical protein
MRSTRIGGDGQRARVERADRVNPKPPQKGIDMNETTTSPRESWAPYLVWCPENPEGHRWKVARVGGRITQVCRWCGIERAERRART